MPFLSYQIQSAILLTMKSVHPIFSIVTVTRSDLEGLKRTVQSVLDQTLPCELIIVDGDSEGSAVRNYLDSLSSKIHTISWESRRDRGLYHAMNKGLAKVSGEFVLFLNSSDSLHNSRVLEDVKKLIVPTRASWAVGMAIRIQENGVPVAVWEYLDHSEWGLALGFRTFCHQSVFYRTSLIKDFQYDEDLLCADHLMNLKFYKEYPPTMMPLVTTYFQNGGISSKRSLRDTSRDLRTARKRVDSLILGNSVLDFIVFTLVLSLLKSNGALWNWLRKGLPKLVKIRFGARIEGS